MLAALTAVLLALPAAAQPARIGAAAAVSGVVRASAPGEVGRVIGSGKPLFLNDHVTTDANGRLQIMLLDETVFTLGPNADMVLDEFVYDPDTGAGKVAANITKGAFRFVTGKIARNRPEDMNVKLKVGTIGIRGTVVVGETGDEGSTIINAGASSGNNAGEPASNVLAENDGRSTLIAKPGDGVTIKPDEPPSNPTDMTGQLDQLSGQLGANAAPAGDQQASKGSSRGEGADEEGGEESASRTAGQTTAQGQDLAEEESVVGDSTGDADALVVIAEQTESLGDGVAQWADLARLQGMGYYNSGSGTYACSGTCSGTGDFSFNFTVNFDARQITSGSVSFSNGGLSGNNASLASTIGYSTLAGDATFSPFASSFSGTTASFENAAGAAGALIRLNLNYNDGNAQATGTGTSGYTTELPQ